MTLRTRNGVDWLWPRAQAFAISTGRVLYHASRLGWPALALLVIVVFYSDAKILLQKVAARIEAGSAVKIGPFEFGSLQGIPAVGSDRIGAAEFVLKSSHRASKEWSNVREAYYGPRERAAALVHRLYRSRTAGQLYDALIYILPHKEASLAGVSRVEYYFGTFWGDRVFESTDRSRGFPIKVSAYGPFLALARLYYNDGSTRLLHRYIDFEMGDVAPPLPARAELRVPKSLAPDFRNPHE
jgi:hypothetical protein